MEMYYMICAFTCFLQKLALTRTPEAFYVKRDFMLLVEKFQLCAEKMTLAAFQGIGFDSQNLHGSSQPSLTLTPGGLTPFGFSEN